MGVRRHAIARGMAVGHSLQAGDGREIRVAQATRRLDQRVEHGLQIKCRAANDLEYVGGGGLLLKRLASPLSSRVFSMAMTACAAKFAAVDLLVGERANFLAVNANSAEEIIVLHHRENVEDCSRTREGDDCGCGAAYPPYFCPQKCRQCELHSVDLS